MALLKALGGILGLLQQDPLQYLQDAGSTDHDGYTAERIEQLIQQRLVARANKNYSEADRIRKELMDASIMLEDGTEGTTWRRS